MQSRHFFLCAFPVLSCACCLYYHALHFWETNLAAGYCLGRDLLFLHEMRTENCKWFCLFAFRDFFWDVSRPHFKLLSFFLLFVMVHHELQSALITGITGHLLQHELFDQLIKPKLLYASFTELYKHLSVLLNSSEGIYHGPMELRASQTLKWPWMRCVALWCPSFPVTLPPSPSLWTISSSVFSQVWTFTGEWFITFIFLVGLFEHSKSHANTL